MSVLETQAQRYWHHASQLSGLMAREPFAQPAAALQEIALNCPIDAVKARATNLRHLRGYRHAFAGAPTDGDAA